MDYKGYEIRGIFAPGAMVQIFLKNEKIKQFPFGCTEETAKAWVDDHEFLSGDQWTPEERAKMEKRDA
jgi:hypothetical protein